MGVEALPRRLGVSVFAKRLMDFMLTVPAIVFLSPIFLIIALGIKLDSRGPVFYRQVRVGRGGKPFRIWKFRSMVWPEDDAGARITIGGDSRITKFGRFVRRYKLDELPQLFNVLFGEMSLVGPRPEVPEYVALYPENTRLIVLSVRPGITDTASLVFRDENEILVGSSDPERTYRETILPRKLALNESYVANQSLIRDAGLILRTVFAMFAPAKSN